MSTDSSLRSVWVAMATADCVHCNGGTGLRSPEVICACVYRNITRAVLAHVRSLYARIGSVHPLPMDSASAPQGKKRNGILSIEYVSDVYNTARRALLDPVDWDMWRYHCLGGHPWYECCPGLGLNRGNFYHRLYDIEARMGRIFLELAPYPLFPIHCYMDTKLEHVRPCPVSDAQRDSKRVPLRPPLAQPRIVLVPVSRAPEPVPAVVVPVLMDEAAVAAHCRAAYRAGRSLRAITDELARLSVLGPRGAPKWTSADVKRILLTVPYEKAPRLRRAA